MIDGNTSCVTQRRKGRANSFRLRMSMVQRPGKVTVSVFRTVPPPTSIILMLVSSESSRAVAPLDQIHLGLVRVGAVLEIQGGYLAEFLPSPQKRGMLSRNWTRTRGTLSLLPIA